MKIHYGLLNPGYYWTASRGNKPGTGDCWFGVFAKTEYGERNHVYSYNLCVAYGSDGFNEFECRTCDLVPVVTIKSDSLDISNPTNNSGKWGYAWKIQ